MFQDIIPHEFHNEFTEQPPSAGDYLLCFQEERLLAALGEGCLSFPRFGEFSEISVENCRYLFSVDDCHFYWYDAALVEKEGYEYLGPQALRNASPGWQAFAGAVGLHLVRWYRRRRFCGQCGKKMEHHHLERALFCPACGNVEYPSIAPSVIVAVTHGDRLLLTKYAGRPYRRYALVAGYSEIGETVEATVHREVMEEVGLRVKNLRYYKSQPWPFSETLLMGFFAELDGSDEIVLEEKELAEARWFPRKEIPPLDNTVSLTNEMIELFRRGGASLSAIGKKD